jgi:hypothetical protein
MSRVNRSPWLHPLFNFTKVDQKLRLGVQPTAATLRTMAAAEEEEEKEKVQKVSAAKAEEEPKLPPSTDAAGGEEEKEKVAKVPKPEPEEQTETLMLLPSLPPMPRIDISSSPLSKERMEEMWPEDENVIKLVSGDFPDTLSPLPLGQGNLNNSSSATLDDSANIDETNVVPFSLLGTRYYLMSPFYIQYIDLQGITSFF